MLVSLLAAAAAGALAVPRAPTFQTARPTAPRIALHARPGGPVVAELRARTEFGSPLVLGVAERRGQWVGVITSTLANGRLGWVRREALELAPAAYSITVDLSRGELVLLRDEIVVRTAAIGSGRSSSPTPTGRFVITDKLAGSAVYGCCILALSGHQPHPPAGWDGGTRLAIHGGRVGGAVSAGCFHVGEDDLRLLMRIVPLGTPVSVRT